MGSISTVGPQETINAGIKNKYTMQPWGARKTKFKCSDNVASITLSNRQNDGVTFTYDMGLSNLVPRIGDYIFQNNHCSRAWITAIDPVTKTLVLDQETIRPPLEEGEAIYSRGVWSGVIVPDWFEPMQIWGCMLNFLFSNGHDGRDDFVELSIVDVNDLFSQDAVCQKLFNVNADSVEPILRSLGWDNNGEYGHWTKYYDESWVVNVNGKMIMTPDGAPGELMPFLETRISYFASRTDDTIVEAYVDYLTTAEI